MSFVNRLATIVPSFGTPLNNDTLYLKQSTTITVDGTTTLSSLSPTLRSGWVRTKFSAGAGTSPTVVSVTITVSDGTTTYTIGSFFPGTATVMSSTSGLDVLFPFLVDINVTTLNVVVDVGGTTPSMTLDIEVAGTAGNS